MFTEKLNEDWNKRQNLHQMTAQTNAALVAYTLCTHVPQSEIRHCDLQTSKTPLESQT